ncbi:MAG TPA: SDR family NAD(P)-dependent oxidoreductase [Planctomycetota bacterium]|nr:SDR family NAD(P)-dependent oxidoreductase [Planctomycetota bacterium]
MDLKTKTVLVTGGTKGIGAATAMALAREGASVALVARNLDDEARKIRSAIEALGRRSVLVSADLSKPEESARAVQETVRGIGPVDVLVHAAGGPVNGGLFDLTPESWYGAFDIHVHPIFHLCRAVIPAMKEKREGAIVLVSSTAGIRGIRTNVAYQAVKGAIPQLTRALAFEFADWNIRVNCVAPGVIRTAFHAKMTPEVKKHNLDNRIPLHREGTPDQVASVIRELVTNDYLTGETYTIDGGLTMRIC